MIWLRADKDVEYWILERSCPSCGDHEWLHTDNEDEYVDDEWYVDMYVNNKEVPRKHQPYKAWRCDGCGCEWSVYLGPIHIEITKESNCGLEIDEND